MHELQQAIMLLQLSRQELVDVASEELLGNPMLEDALELPPWRAHTSHRDRLATPHEEALSPAARPFRARRPRCGSSAGEKPLHQGDELLIQNGFLHSGPVRAARTS
jgi:DNA-directed RNA polymerase specialized sigma54-like protein